jgi:hypothetical protein
VRGRGVGTPLLDFAEFYRVSADECLRAVVRDPYAAVEIRPSALPPGSAVYINDTSNAYGYLGLTVGLVRTGPRCTTSS